MSVLDNISGFNVKLGSGSPRRRELLAMLGIPFEVASLGDVDESYPADMDPLEVPHFLALKKAEACRAVMGPGDLFITADTVVVCQGQVLGKPHDCDDARRMLHMLSDRRHTVVTGVAVTTLELTVSDRALTEVEFAPLTDAEIDEYVDRYRPLDKAGAYGIQEWIGAIGIKGISGSFYNVMGLPMHLLYTLLRKL